MAERTYSVGEPVHVPWGLDVVEGVVVSAYGSGEARQVVVKVMLPDAPDDAEDTTVTLPASALEAADLEADERRPGSWLPALHYERELTEAITSIVRRIWGDRARLERPASSAEPELARNVRADIEIKLSDRTVLIEAKAPASGRVSERTVTALVVLLAAAHAAAGLLVTNGELSPGAEERVRDANREGVPLRAVTWRSQRDNQNLARALGELLAA